MTAECRLCPRKCGVKRAEKQTGYCGMTDELYVARAALHMWEEPCISGEEGSGAVFFSGCNLRCVFCQNHEIAAGRAGKKIDINRLAQIFLELQDKRANNINLVTPTHYIPQIIAALKQAKQMGLHLPVVYNSSAYENAADLRRLEGLIDIYLPDFKYVSGEAALKYSNAPDYFQCADAALREMYRQVGAPQFDARGMMTRGMIVRHLMLPSLAEDSKRVIQYLYSTYRDNIYISIMNQYTPLSQVQHIPELNRRITQQEYDALIDYALDLGVVNGFIQEEGTAEESFIPAFDYEGV